MIVERERELGISIRKVSGLLILLNKRVQSRSLCQVDGFVDKKKN